MHVCVCELVYGFVCMLVLVRVHLCDVFASEGRPRVKIPVRVCVRSLDVSCLETDLVGAEGYLDCKFVLRFLLTRIRMFCGSCPSSKGQV